MYSFSSRNINIEVYPLFHVALYSIMNIIWATYFIYHLQPGHYASSSLDITFDFTILIYSESVRQFRIVLYSNPEKPRSTR